MESKTLIDKQSDRPFTEFPSYTIPCLGNWFSYGEGGGGMGICGYLQVL